MSIPSIGGSAPAVSFQFQTAATKTALDAQKQEGENAVDLIESAVQATEHSAAGSNDTGNNVDTVI